MPAPSEILRRGLAAGGRTQVPVPVDFEAPTISVTLNEDLLGRVEAYARLLDFVPGEVRSAIEGLLTSLGKIYVGLIRQKMEDMDLIFTGQLQQTIDYRLVPGSTQVGGVTIPDLVVGSFPGEAGVETEAIRAPVSYVYPILYGTAPYAKGSQPPFLRIAYWAANKLNIDFTSPEGAKHIRGIYGKIVRDGVAPHDFLSEVSPDTPEAQRLIQEAERVLERELVALIPPPPDEEWRELAQGVEPVIQRRRQAYQRINEEFERAHAAELVVPKAVRRAAAIAAIAIRRRAARRVAREGIAAPTSAEAQVDNA